MCYIIVVPQSEILMIPYRSNPHKKVKRESWRKFCSSLNLSIHIIEFIIDKLCVLCLKFYTTRQRVERMSLYIIITISGCSRIFAGCRLQLGLSNFFDKLFNYYSYMIGAGMGRLEFRARCLPNLWRIIIQL